jgi:hypothetical protein
MELTMRAARVTSTAVALFALLATAGCGSIGGGQAADQPSTAAAPASTPAEVTPSATPTPSPTPTPTPAVLSLTQAQVSAALLTAADLGTGWGPDTSGMFSSNSSNSKGAKYAPASCADAAAALDAADKPSSATGEATFTTADTSKLLDETIDSVPGSTTEDLTTFLAMVATCPKFTETDTDGTVVSYEMSGSTVPGLGDAAAALHILATSSGLTIPMDAVFVQVGEEQISLMGLGFDSPTAMLPFARTATSKVAGVHA